MAFPKLLCSWILGIILSQFVRCKCLQFQGNNGGKPCFAVSADSIRKHGGEASGFLQQL